MRMLLAIEHARPAPLPGVDVAPLVLWLGLLMLVVTVLGLVLFWIRRRLLAKESLDAPQTVSLQSLREMKSRGELSDAEFEAAKAAVLEQVGKLSPRRGGADDPASALRPKSQPGSLRAPPGFDLTGEPLPTPHDPGQG